MKTFRTATAVAALAILLLPNAAAACPRPSISGTFADSCRDFAAHSSRDITRVELRYADGRVHVPGGVSGRDYAVDGGSGDEIASASVTSARTTRTFTCESGRPPSALLEVRLSPGCSQPRTSGSGETTYWCTDGLPNDQRTVHVDPGDLRVDLLCDFTTENLPCTTVSFRGTGSSDPDGDLASWSVEFDDGTVATGDWATSPPLDVTHEYHPLVTSCSDSVCNVTLTVTDSGGRTATDALTLIFVDATPD